MLPQDRELAEKLMALSIASNRIALKVIKGGEVKHGIKDKIAGAIKKFTGLKWANH